MPPHTGPRSELWGGGGGFRTSGPLGHQNQGDHTGGRVLMALSPPCPAPLLFGVLPVLLHQSICDGATHQLASLSLCPSPGWCFGLIRSSLSLSSHACHVSGLSSLPGSGLSAIRAPEPAHPGGTQRGCVRWPVSHSSEYWAPGFKQDLWTPWDLCRALVGHSKEARYEACPRLGVQGRQAGPWTEHCGV